MDTEDRIIEIEKEIASMKHAMNERLNQMMGNVRKLKFTIKGGSGKT